MSDEVRYVRLLPYNEKLGHLRRQHSVRFSGRYHKFNEPGVWIKVPLDLANRLAEARQFPGIEGSPRVFDVCTEHSARQLDAQAKAERDALKARVEPTVDTAREIVIADAGDEGEGRGDLSLDDVTAGRFSALEEVAARAAGEPEATPTSKPKPRRSRKASRRKK